MSLMMKDMLTKFCSGTQGCDDIIDSVFYTLTPFWLGSHPNCGEAEGGRRGCQPSPNSANSTDVIASSDATQHQSLVQSFQNLAQISSESMENMLAQARQVASFAGLVRRSCLGFQSFIERPDYSNSQHYKEASMHVAALSMDLGMVGGFRQLTRANKAIDCILAAAGLSK